MSAIIFVVLALAWAVYLLPKALKHHDELASDRLVEGHSDRVRILSRKGQAGQPEVVEVEIEHVDSVDRFSDLERELAPKPRQPVVRQPVARRPVTRATARKAARRRRRVLGVLVLALLVVWALTWLAYLPIWAPAVPGALVVGWLLLARLSVRKVNSGRGMGAAVGTTSEADDFDEVDTEVEIQAPEKSCDLVDLLAEDTVGLRRQELETAIAEEGSLWDPLPVTLPTYVNKARARRTVRTIELTGINSSGHDEADTTLAREAKEQTKAATGADAEAAQRKAAGA